MQRSTETEAVAREDGLDGAEDLREPDETAGEEPEQSETEVTETVSEPEAEETDPRKFFPVLRPGYSGFPAVSV